MQRSLSRSVTVVSLGVLLIILGSAAFGIINLISVRSLTYELNEHLITEADLAYQFHIDLSRAVAEAQNTFLSDSEAEFSVAFTEGEADEAQQGLEDAEATLNELREAVLNHSDHNDLQHIQKLQEINQQRADLLQTVGALLHKAATEKSEEQVEAVEQLEEVEATLEELDAVSQEMTKLNRERAILTTETILQRSIYSVGFAFSLSVLMIIGTIFLLHWRVVKPVRTLALAAQNLSTNDFNQPILVTSSDEIGTLQRSFNQMAAAIREQTSRLEQEILAANTARHQAEQAQIQVTEQLAQLDAQQIMIRELSVPVMPLNASTLVMPLVGVLDESRLVLLQEQTLQAIERHKTRYLLLDITGIPLIDTQVVQGLIKVIQMAQLLGTQVILVGIRPEVAQSIVSLGIRLDGLITCSTLQSGMSYASGQRSLGRYQAIGA